MIQKKNLGTKKIKIESTGVWYWFFPWKLFICDFSVLELGKKNLATEQTARPKDQQHLESNDAYFRSQNQKEKSVKLSIKWFFFVFCMLYVGLFPSSTEKRIIKALSD